jgi:drug/metabolite transporter (DMT)-like permease
MSAALLYGLVVLSAIAHAAWNALVKSAGDRMLTMVAIRTTGMMFGLATIAAFIAIGEALSATQVAAVALISLGIMVLSLAAGASGAAVGFALATGVVVATYSFFAGLGVRAAGTVLGFQACLEVVTGFGTLCYGIAVRRADALDYARRRGAIGFVAGGVSVLGFLAFLVAAKSLPLGPVSAVRETSVIFGAVLGTFVLKEGFGPRRIAAAIMVTVGIVLLAVVR